MLKFFRKNEKASRWILIVGMTLLMVSWLVFDRSSTFMTDLLIGRATWATTVDGVTITEGDRLRMQQELRAISLLGDPTVRALGLEKDPVHWFLLTLEAQRAGLVGGVADGQTRLAETATANKVPEGNLLGALCRESGQTPTEVFETLAKLNGVDRYVNLITSGPARVSSTRLEQAAASLLAAVSGEIVVLDGTKSKVDVAAPSEAALQSQLATYGAMKSGEGKCGFGYRIGDRMQIEWLMLPAASIADLVQQSPALSNIELRKYWLEHQADFGLGGVSTTSVATTFDGSRDAVKAKVLAVAIQEKRLEISKFIADRLQMSMRGLSQVDGYYNLPADWKTSQLTLAALGGEVAAKFGIPAPAVVTNGEGWMTPAEINSLPGLGVATTNRFGAQPVTAGQLVQALRELGGKSTLIAQVGVVSPVLGNDAGDLFAFRATAVEASAAPASVDSAREALLADVTRLNRFDKLLGMTSEIQREAVDAGLSAVAATYGVTVEPFNDLRQSDKQFLQYGLKLPGQLAGIGADAATTRAIVERAMSLPSARLIADLPVGERTLVLPVPEKLAVVVVRIDRITPMNQGDLPALVNNQRFRSVAVTDPAAGNPQELFTKEALVARHGFTLVNPAKERDESDAAAPAPATDGAVPVAPAKAGQ
ncbi:MAG: hypothetical protein EXS17_03220 [Phycisphaerales bacterium]|nr:hypothetical protein [Phycisphaerales bacterium]